MKLLRLLCKLFGHHIIPVGPIRLIKSTALDGTDVQDLGAMVDVACPRCDVKFLYQLEDAWLNDDVAMAVIYSSTRNVEEAFRYRNGRIEYLDA